MVLNKAKNELKRLNLGCGLNAPSGWINIDASFTARLSKWRRVYAAVCKIMRIDPVPWPKNIKILDVRKGLPFPENSVQAIFSSHLLEHMSFEDANFVINECYRVLCKGGGNTHTCA
jgi:predicted SAM-dependent methyltransferase